VAQFERELTRERVVAGVKAARARGAVLGRPRLVFRRDHVQEMRTRGMSWRAIEAETGVSVRVLRRVCGEIVLRPGVGSDESTALTTVN
jgi:DNA invertase Pin-like site-specific DNA recombinase